MSSTKEAHKLYTIQYRANKAPEQKAVDSIKNKAFYERKK